MPKWWVPEQVSFAVNLITLVMILAERPFSLGRTLYWVGATILVAGLIVMRLQEARGLP